MLAKELERKEGEGDEKSPKFEKEDCNKKRKVGEVDGGDDGERSEGEGSPVEKKVKLSPKEKGKGKSSSSSSTSTPGKKKGKDVKEEYLEGLKEKGLDMSAA